MKFKKEKKEQTPATEEDKDKSMIFYGVIFIVILVVALITRFAPKDESEENNQNNNIPQQENISFESIKNNNYDEEIYIITNNDLLNLAIRRENSNKEAISKTYNKEENNYYRTNFDIYHLEGPGKINIVNNIKFYEDFDETFLNISNIESLLNNPEIKFSENGYKVYRYLLDMKDIINIYNKYNNTDLKNDLTEKALLELRIKEGESIFYNIDLTHLYKLLGKDYRYVRYEVKYENFGNISLKDFEDLITKSN